MTTQKDRLRALIAMWQDWAAEEESLVKMCDQETNQKFQFQRAASVYHRCADMLAEQMQYVKED